MAFQKIHQSERSSSQLSRTTVGGDNTPGGLAVSNGHSAFTCKHGGLMWGYKMDFLCCRWQRVRVRWRCIAVQSACQTGVVKNAALPDPGGTCSLIFLHLVICFSTSSLLIVFPISLILVIVWLSIVVLRCQCDHGSAISDILYVGGFRAGLRLWWKLEH